MSNRRKRTLQDLCDATPTVSQAETTPILRGNIRMQGPTDEANCNMPTHMVTSENNKGFCSFSDRSQNLYCKGKSGTCNVCSTPCSSCFHANKVLVESNDESAGETCAGDTETGQLSVLSTVGGMDSTADSRTENTAGKTSSKTSNPSVSDDSVVHSKSEGRRSPEGHDDCLSCVSGTDEHTNRRSDTEDSGIKYKKQSICGDITDKVSPAQNPGVVGHSSMKITDDATDLLKVQTTPEAPSGKNLSHDKILGDIKDDKHSNTKEEPLKASTEHLNSLSPSGVPSDVCGNHPVTAPDTTEKNEDMEVEVHPTDETDDSDMVEDVKVCDICGDAGREDLLAVCCRCSDGAEHTYCMREMLLKVPEGDWLCEECKTVVEEAEKARQEKIGRIDKNEKNSSSGQASENLNSSDVEDRRMKGLGRIPSKRFRDDDDAEVSSVAKKPALESIVGSPKTSNSSRTAALSRESSFKNLDRSKLHAPRVSSPETVPVNGTTESAKSASDPRLHNFRGTFSKSNSFNSLNSKPKVKLVDQVVIQRQKSAKEHSSIRLKDGAVRSIGKSMSFKSTNCSRSESKTKMLSPRQSHVQDIKNTKEKSTFERQRSLKAEHPSNNSMMGTRVDKRSASRLEPSSPTAVTSYHEVKPVQADSKTAALSRSSSLAAWRTADLSSSTGEFKRPSAHGHSTRGVSSVNGVNNSEQKNNQTSLKQDSFSEKSSLNAIELPDVLSRPKDLTDSSDRMREYSGSRFGPPSVKSSRDESDNLKAAIEAAVLRKPGVYRKLRAPGQSEEPSVPTVGYEVASHQDHMSIARKKKMSSDAELLERPSVSRNLIVDSLKEETLSNAKQSSLATIDGFSAGGRDGARIGLSSGDVFSNMSAVLPLLLKSLAIPEHEYIWQGSFEICRGGQLFDSWDGIQAHLSTCASPKVIEAVTKFKNRIVLSEVPRLSTWPVQFQENGVREDNIALFFFAKDLDSYIKIYKVLLDKMMRNDLALKGNIDGVDILIFPSNQLPDNLQRWNMLYYLWGVFRGKKESCLQQMPESINQNCAPQNIPAPIMSLPENRCSLRPIAENAREDADSVLAAPVSEELRNLLTTGVSKDSGAEGSSLDKLDHGLSSSSSLVARSDGAKQCQEMKGTNQEGGISSSCITLLAMRSPTSGREHIRMQLDTPLGRQQSPHHPIKSVASMPKEGPGKGVTLVKTCHQNEVENQMNARDLSTSGETPLEDGLSTRDLNVEHSQWLFSHKESLHPVLPQPFYAGPSQMNHVPSGSAFIEPERRFFPVESEPVHDGSMSWKMRFLEDRLRAPNLELALGAESTPPLTLGIEPLLINKVDEKVNEESIVEEAGPKVEDDVSASLSLSLSFPFPEKELNPKPAPKTEQLVAQRKSVNNSSMLLFGNLRDG